MDHQSADPPTRRLSDKILLAFNQACDQHQIGIAELLLQALELALAPRPPASGETDRRARESLAAAHERLWHLRNPSR